MQFLIEIAELVYFARRALSWMYAGRYFITKVNRDLVDFQLNMMQEHLEKMVEKAEFDWVNEYLE